MKRIDHAQIVQLRHEGLTYRALMQRFGIAKSTLWRWFKVEGMVDAESQRYTECRRLAGQKGAALVKARRITRTQASIEQARGEIGSLSRRELWLLGVALYWAEGSKQKPYNSHQRVQFSNSDPFMLKVFIQWVWVVCRIGKERLTFELYIHESGDVGRAKQFWAETLTIPIEQITIRLKRHHVSSYRRNIGRTYVGLVRVSVPQSTDLNRRITGWIDGIVQAIGESAKGKPSDFESEYPGSIPGSPASYGAEGPVDDEVMGVADARGTYRINRIAELLTGSERR